MLHRLPRPDPPVSAVVACIDGSAYQGSVCDHAAWLAAGQEASLELLHVRDPRRPEAGSRRLLDEAAARIADHGVAVDRARLAEGPLPDALIGAEADMLVLGKRGENARRRRTLGSNAAALLERSATPLCLVSQVHLSVDRALVLIDADPDHRRSVEGVAGAPALARLELDVVLMEPPGTEGDRKLQWARDRLGGQGADVFPLACRGPEAAAARYMEDHQVDLIVASREMLSGAVRPTNRAAWARPLWAWRTPVLIF